jgi:hypothetical protein
MTLDKVIEAAAWRVRPFTDLRLSLAEVKRIDAGLTLLREREAEAAPKVIPPAIAAAIETWHRTRRI